LKLTEKLYEKNTATIFAYLFLLLLSSVSFAMQYTEMKFIGFSKNGKYLAFEESGTIGGNHGQFFTTYYVDVAKNSFALAPTLLEMPEGKMRQPYLVRREFQHLNRHYPPDSPGL
jgi:predicted secreted protein